MEDLTELAYSRGLVLIDVEDFSARTSAAARMQIRGRLTALLEWCWNERCRDCNEPAPCAPLESWNTSGTYQCSDCAWREVTNAILAASVPSVVLVDVPGTDFFTSSDGHPWESAYLVTTCWEAGAGDWPAWDGQHRHSSVVSRAAAPRLQAAKWRADCGQWCCGCSTDGRWLAAPRASFARSAWAAVASCGRAFLAARSAQTVQAIPRALVGLPPHNSVCAICNATSPVRLRGTRLLGDVLGRPGADPLGAAGHLSVCAPSRWPVAIVRMAVVAHPAGAAAAALELLPPHVNARYGNRPGRAAGQQPGRMCLNGSSPWRPRLLGALPPRSPRRDRSNSAQTTASLP